MINGNTPRPRSPWSCQRVARNRAPVCPLSALPSAAETSLRSPVCQIPQFRSATVEARDNHFSTTDFTSQKHDPFFHSTSQFFPSLPLRHFFPHFFDEKSLVCPTVNQSFLPSSTMFHAWNGN